MSRLRAVFTDLDGTLLEPDGSLCPEAETELVDLARRGISVHALTSKTPAELSFLVEKLCLCWPAGFENGAGLIFSDHSVELTPAAIPLDDLLPIVDQLRQEAGIPFSTMIELEEEALSSLTGLSAEEVQRAKARVASVPLLLDVGADAAVLQFLPRFPGLKAVRGNRFLHLQGDHDKGTVWPILEASLPPTEGLVIGLGDSPNDEGLLRFADIPVIVPSAKGPHPILVQRFPDALIASQPHGRGWASAIRSLIKERFPC